MKRREHRHPALETAVFAAAILLFAFVARELWRRRPVEAVVPAKAAIAAPIELVPERPVVSAPTKAVSRTETSVKSVPSIKLTRVSRRRKTEPVPVPK